MRSFYDVLEMNVYRAGHICLKFRSVGNTNMADEQTYETGSTPEPLALGAYSDV
jgi:hypothetical protein